MTKDELNKQVTETADHCRKIGMSVKINYGLPWVDVSLGSDEYGDEIAYFFQGEEATNLINECPDYLNEEDFILWSAQGW